MIEKYILAHALASALAHSSFFLLKSDHHTDRDYRPAGPYQSFSRNPINFFMLCKWKTPNNIMERLIYPFKTHQVSTMR